tara:strand:- start:63 stop:1403 length:1341 start_codon:yes stop_codon:yes gene_type:complete
MTSNNSNISTSESFLNKIYYKFIPFKYRYGGEFNSYFKFLQQSLEWDITKLKEYQNEEFLTLIKHCLKNVPYYKKMFADYGISTKIKSIDDINLIPILTKKNVVENLEDLQATNFDNIKKYPVSTSGTTGEKLKFFVTDDVFKKEAAFVLRYYNISGANMYDVPSIWIRRYVPKNSDSPLWYYDYELKRLYMSAYHLNENTVRKYFEKINSINATTLVTYPSSAYILALLAKKYQLKLKHIKHIHVASEKITKKWVAEVKSVFEIDPLTHYGQIEKVSFMHQELKDMNYHINYEYGVTEFTEGNNSSRKIIGTGFLNYFMPFLRYETNDLAIINKKNNNLIIEDIEGRTSDILVSEDGTLLPGVNFFSWLDKNINGLGLFQIHQFNDKRVEFSYVPKEGFIIDEDTIIKGLKQRLGNLPIKIIKKNKINRDTNTGKFKIIKNEIQF